MTAKRLKAVIRKIVSEEIKNQLNEIFINDKEKVNLVELSKEVKPKKQVKQVEKKQYTKNKSLNEVLNETVGLSSKSSETDEYPTMGGKPFDSSRMAEMLGYGSGKDVKRDMVGIDTAKKAGVDPNSVPDGVMNALTRDYSDLMKHINKKKQ